MNDFPLCLILNSSCFVQFFSNSERIFLSGITYRVAENMLLLRNMGRQPAQKLILSTQKIAPYRTEPIILLRRNAGPGKA